MLQEVSLKNFLKYCEEKNKLSQQINYIKDPRKNPKIKLVEILQSIIIGASLEIESFLQLDKMLRTKPMLKIMDSKRKQVASDTTLFRLCEEINTKEVGELLKRIARSIGMGNVVIEKSAEKSQRIGIIDGTGIGKKLASVLVEAGENPTILGIDKMAKRGKELPTSFRLIRKQEKGFLDLLGGDGLYACEGFWKTCKKMKVNGFVKTSEEDLHIIRDANGVFDITKKLDGVEYVRGTDVQRNCTYKIWAAEGFEWSTTNIRLKVARVRERYFKGKYAGQIKTFYVLCQDTNQDGLSLRELGHNRWFIENNVFKSANEQSNTKRLFSSDPETSLVISTLQMIGFMLISDYKNYLKQYKQYLKNFWDHGRLSLITIRKYLWISLGLEVNSS